MIFPYFEKNNTTLCLLIFYFDKVVIADTPSILFSFMLAILLKDKRISILAHASLLAVFVCLFIVFQSQCSHARVFGKTLLHEFPIFVAILNGRYTNFGFVNGLTLHFSFSIHCNNNIP